MRWRAPDFVHVAITGVTGRKAPSQTVPCLLARFESHLQATLDKFETKMAARKAAARKVPTILRKNKDCG